MKNIFCAAALALLIFLPAAARAGETELRVGNMGSSIKPAMVVLAHEIVHADVEQVRETDEDAHVGDPVALLPLGDRLIGVVDLFGELKLRHIRHAPEAHDVFSDGNGKKVLIFHGCIIPDFSGDVNRNP